jgi:hypothetical protein
MGFSLMLVLSSHAPSNSVPARSVEKMVLYM